MDDLERDVLAHLHANDRTPLADVAAALGRSEQDVAGAVDALCAAGHVAREGDHLVPDAASHPTPGLFIASERGDATPVEVDVSEDER